MLLSLALLIGPRSSYAADVRAYLAECRELAERLPACGAAEFKRRYDRVLERYAEVRSQRSGVTNRDAQLTFARIDFHFRLAQVLVNQREYLLRQGLRSRARQAQAALRRIESDQLRRIAEVERLPRGSR